MFNEIIFAYQDSSLPVASFVWSIENLDDEPAEISLMFTWQAGSGLMPFFIELNHHLPAIFFHLASDEFFCDAITHESVRVSDEDLSAVGISIRQKLREMKLEYCILGKQEVRIYFSSNIRNLFLF